MEKTDRLDEFLQRKFAEDDPAYRLTFQEEYWIQAQALIESKERHYKRRRAVLWLFAAGGIVILLTACLWIKAEPVNRTNAIPKNSHDSGSSKMEKSAVPITRPGADIIGQEPSTGNGAVFHLEKRKTCRSPAPVEISDANKPGKYTDTTWADSPDYR